MFFTKKDVRRHLVVHTKDRDFMCHYCPQRFGRRDHLVRHLRKAHARESGDAVGSSHDLDIDLSLNYDDGSSHMVSQLLHSVSQVHIIN